MNGWGNMALAQQKSFLNTKTSDIFYKTNPIAFTVIFTQ